MVVTLWWGLKCKVESENNLPQVVTVFFVLIEKYLELWAHQDQMYPGWGWGWANILVDSVRPSPTISSCHHQNSCQLHISACNGLTKLTRLTPQQQQSAMWSFRNIFTRRNIKIQIYSSHSIHVLVLNGSTDIVRHFRDWYKSRLQYKCVKRTAVALSSHWHVKLEWA